jgi:hypothetical protein
MASHFDFADPDLWKSNAFASMRPTLVDHVEAAIIDYEKDLVWNRRRRISSPGIARRLARAREILQLLLGPDGDTSIAAIAERAQAWSNEERKAWLARHPGNPFSKEVVHARLNDVDDEAAE